jgi:hypothetical protein
MPVVQGDNYGLIFVPGDFFCQERRVIADTVLAGLKATAQKSYAH